MKKIEKENIEKKVKKTIEKYKLIKEKDKLLIAISGGKDSSALTYILHKLGYEFEGIFIDLEIEGYSKECLSKAKEIFEIVGKKLNIIKVSEYGVKVVKLKNRPICSVCGVIKRYLINRFAFENKFSVVATGHNLTDELIFTFNNFKSGNIELLLRQNIANPQVDKLVKKVKPLYFTSEKEIENYVLKNKIPFLNKKCPYYKGSAQDNLKEIIFKLDEIYPNFSENFMKTLRKLIKKILIKEKFEIYHCRICSYPTSLKTQICSFCKIKRLLENERKNV